MTAVHFTDERTGHAVSLGNSILKTVDGGKSWKTYNLDHAEVWGDAAAPAHIILHSLHFTDPQTGYASGEEGVIVKTTDGGETWKHQYSGSYWNLQSIFFTDPKTGYIVGQSGTILKLSVGPLGGISRQKFSPKGLFSVKDGWIAYRLKHSSRIQATLYDARGKLTLKILDQIQDPGVHNEPMLVKNIPQGQYLLEIRVDGFRRAVPFLAR